MLHGPLSKLNPAHYASVKNIIALIESSQHFIAVAQEIAELLLLRFKPTATTPKGIIGGIDDQTFALRVSALEKKIKEFHGEAPRVLLLKMLHAMIHVRRTNFYNKDRYALSFRIDPIVMVPADTQTVPSASADVGTLSNVNVKPASQKPMPFGVFFVHGRNFNAFHCRFRDIARGYVTVSFAVMLASDIELCHVYFAVACVL